MSSFNLEKESYLLDLAAGAAKGLRDKRYILGETTFLAKELAIRMYISDPETGRKYSVIFKERKDEK